jgi:hypothetical protein
MSIKEAYKWSLTNCPGPKAYRWVINHFKNLDTK